MISKYYSVQLNKQSKIVILGGIDCLSYRPCTLFEVDTWWTEEIKTHAKIKMTLVQLQRINKEIPIKSNLITFIYITIQSEIWILTKTALASILTDYKEENERKRMNSNNFPSFGWIKLYHRIFFLHGSGTQFLFQNHKWFFVRFLPMIHMFWIN